MDIKIGHVYINKTQKYLRPALRVFGTTFVAKFNLFQKLAYGLHDTLLDGTPIQHQRTIFILIDKFVQPVLFKDSLNWMKHQEYYITDYPFDNLEGRLHMLVLEFPEEHSNIYDNFAKSKYSEMYCKDELNMFFAEDDCEVKDVLTRSPRAKSIFIDQVNSAFSTDMVDFEKGQKVEYDFPLSRQQEYFNQK